MCAVFSLSLYTVYMCPLCKYVRDVCECESALCPGHACARATFPLERERDESFFASSAAARAAILDRGERRRERE